MYIIWMPINMISYTYCKCDR